MAYLVVQQPGWLAGWGKRKKITVTSVADIRSDVINFYVYNTTGTDVPDYDTHAIVYIGANARSDWGDLRVTKADGLTRIPFCVLRKDTTFAYIAVKCDVKDGATSFYLYYSGPSADVFTIASISDQHYGTPDTYADRNQALTYIGNFNTRAVALGADLIACNGDHTHYTPTTEATQLGFMQAVFDKVHEVTTIDKIIVAPGNHDFEYMSFTNVRALVDDYQSWMESGALYGIAYETDDYMMISLDANYNNLTGAHMSITHQGYGFISGAQLTWLAGVLAAATKEVIIFCHQPLSEMDTDQWTLTKEIYHTVNRREVRTIIEKSKKVIAVIHGHTHYSRVDVIRGIPYIDTGNLTNDGSFGELPASSSGRWDILRFDKSTRTIRCTREAQISGTIHTIYDRLVGYGPTQYSEDSGDSAELVFRNKFGGWGGKSSIASDPVQFYVENDDYLYKFPANLNTPDDTVQSRAIRIQGRTNTPNFGRARWGFNTTKENFIFEMSVLPGDISTLSIKLGGSDTTNTPLVYLQFQNDGDLILWDASTEVVIGTYTVGTWYRITLFVDVTSNVFLFRLNDTYYGTLRGFYNSNVCHYFSTLELVTETGDFWVQNPRVRKWYPTRRQIAFNAQETV